MVDNEHPVDPERELEADPDAPPSEDEMRLAEELRRGLDAAGGASSENAEVELARSLRAAHAPTGIDEHQHRAIVARALAAHDRRRRTRVVRISVGVATVVALAAAILLLIGKLRAPGDEAIALAGVRSTEALFHEPFPREGGESQRIDRIAMARAGDLRDNRFARWGVR